jgi:hypothetical protein
MLDIIVAIMRGSENEATADAGGLLEACHNVSASRQMHPVALKPSFHLLRATASLERMCMSPSDAADGADCGDVVVASLVYLNQCIEGWMGGANPIH